MMAKPRPHLGLRHIALFSKNLEASVKFYSEILGLKIVWQPDNDNVYLSSGDDNVALHRAPADFQIKGSEHLDHFGFFVKDKNDVDAWFEFLAANKVTIKAAPKDHRDGTRSMYCADPDGNVIQFIHYPL